MGKSGAKQGPNQNDRFKANPVPTNYIRKERIGAMTYKSNSYGQAASERTTVRQLAQKGIPVRVTGPVTSFVLLGAPSSGSGSVKDRELLSVKTKTK